MMHSIRTRIPEILTKDFEKFAKKLELQTLCVGNYTDFDNGLPYICYAYSDKNNNLTSLLTVLTLKYGGIEKAYGKYYKGEKVTV